MSELAKRVGFALPAAAFFLWMAWLGGWYFKTVVLLITFMAIFEMISLFTKNGLSVDGYFPFTIGLWILLLPEIPYAIQIGLGMYLLFVIIQLIRQPASLKGVFSNTLFCGIYAPLGFLALLMLRSVDSGLNGFLFVLAVLLMIWGNDVFAYFGGKWFGERRMSPDISPKKTWEGFFFGFIGSIAGLGIPLYLLPVKFPLTALEALPMVAVISLLGPAGDLVISKMKRETGVKDTSHILPGHGGILDRFDALILAVPGVYLYLFVMGLI